MYITPDELTKYYDARRLLGLVSDTGTPILIGALPTDPVALTACRQASAKIDSALQTGKRYDRSTFENIVTAANAGGATEAEKMRAEPIKALTAHLAFGYVVARRGFGADQMRQMAPLYDAALEMLNELSSGTAVFDLDGPKAAGVPVGYKIGSSRLKWSAYSPMFGVFPVDASGYLYPGV